MSDDPPTERVWRFLEEIKQLNLEELTWLRRHYRAMWEEGDEEGGIGVREPRTPRPESPGDAIALEIEQQGN